MDFIGGFQQLLTYINRGITSTTLSIGTILPSFSEFGLEMDEFGGNTIRIRQIPTIWKIVIGFN